MTWETTGDQLRRATQVTIYLDDKRKRRLRRATRESGMPVSRWVAALIEEKTPTEWPESVRQLAGSWDDFPNAEQVPATQAPDTSREPL